MPSVEEEELLCAFENAESLAQAERALDELRVATPPAHVELGDLHDGLAEAAAESDDFETAVRVQRRAVELGCEYPELAREMLAWYLLKAGRKQEGEVAFTKLQAERGDGPEVLLVLAEARMDSGDGDGALEAFDAALASARRRDDDDWIREVRGERRYARAELGLEPDEEDLLSNSSPDERPRAPVRWSLAWFPREEIAAALARWPSLSDDLHDADAYCRAIEIKLQTIMMGSGARPAVAPLRVETLVSYADEHGLDPDEGATRSQLAAELDLRGETLPWPPGRNERCWCGSGRKYKRCCAGPNRSGI